MTIRYLINVPGIFVLIAFVCWAGFGFTGEPASARQHGVYTAGRLLVAVPELQDPYFGRSVILMVKHDEEGAFGLIINLPLGDKPLKDLLRGVELDTENAPLMDRHVRLLYGGPVESHALFIIHSNDYQSEYTNRISDLFSFANTLQTLRHIAEGKGPEEVLFVIGYAGWAAGQLDDEIDRGDWLVAPATQDLVFGGNEDLKWKRASKSAGLDL